MCVMVCQGAQWVLLTEDEVKERFVVIEERKKRIIENKLRAQLREEKRQKSEELLSKLAEARLHQKLEQQGQYCFSVSKNKVSRKVWFIIHHPRCIMLYKFAVDNF